MNIDVRYMRVEDVLKVSELEKQCFSVPWSYNSLMKEVDNESSLFAVAIKNANVVGYGGMLLVIDEGDIINIAVDEEYRGNGIGRAIMNFLIREGNKLGLQAYTLEVRKSNLAAIGLYKSFGFEEEGIRKNFYEKPSEDALIMWKRLEDKC